MQPFSSLTTVNRRQMVLYLIRDVLYVLCSFFLVVVHLGRMGFYFDDSQPGNEMELSTSAAPF